MFVHYYYLLTYLPHSTVTFTKFLACTFVAFSNKLYCIVVINATVELL